MGCFREEIVKSLYGLAHPDTGKIELEGETVFDGRGGINLVSTPRKAIGRGIGYVTEDRKNAGIFALMTARENLTISIMKLLSKFGLVRAKTEQALLDNYTTKMNMKYRTPHQRINTLSGGNQQKFLLARTLAAKCRVLIMLEPTRGIDVGAKAEIFSLLEDLAKNDMAIIVVSSELQEIIGNCHRSLVIFQGKLTGVIGKEEFDETLIMQCATGNNVYLEKEVNA
jgi:ABC-type sugar transport system ATPase subunit